ncbi:ATP-binding protein [Streptomyces sp. CC228A]|uniref:ATP-binding protein n=1 Tax=Streptomyces sp. CC228A TaxID=2898186 RepID=UPI001F2F82B6|nr:ATP-binding protein [Streptomyces sp. CC228A]
MDTAIAPCGCPATLHVPLLSGGQAARQARQATARLLSQEADACPREVADDLALIVSELVGNAVLHADGPYALTLSLERGRAGVAVSDGTADLSGSHRDAQRTEPGGRGLKIVRALGADLFVSPCGRGKQVIAVLTW